MIPGLLTLQRCRSSARRVAILHVRGLTRDIVCDSARGMGGQAMAISDHSVMKG